MRNQVCVCVCVCVCARACVRARACVLVKRITDKVVFPYEEASSFPQSAQERLPLLKKRPSSLLLLGCSSISLTSLIMQNMYKDLMDSTVIWCPTVGCNIRC